VILAALLNPVPEMVAHLLVSGVAILLYEISIFLIRWETGRHKKQKKIEKSDIQESRLDV
jgi:Sec-independent protein secretion pathway component TatC